jgi:ribosomal protein S27AE
MVWIVWLGGPLAFLMVALANHRWLSDRPFLPFAAIVCFVVTWIVVVRRNNRARCPRCGGSFYLVRHGPESPTSHWNPWRRACGQCGLSLNELKNIK